MSDAARQTLGEALCKLEEVRSRHGQTNFYEGPFSDEDGEWLIEALAAMIATSGQSFTDSMEKLRSVMK